MEVPIIPRIESQVPEYAQINEDEERLLDLIAETIFKDIYPDEEGNRLYTDKH